MTALVDVVSRSLDADLRALAADGCDLSVLMQLQQLRAMRTAIGQMGRTRKRLDKAAKRLVEASSANPAEEPPGPQTHTWIQSWPWARRAKQ